MSKIQARWLNYDTSLTTVGNSLSVRLTPSSLMQKTAEGVQVDPTKVILPNGGTAFSADQSFGGFRATNLGFPTATTDATSKVYVDNLLATTCKKETLVVASNRVTCAYAPLGDVEGIVNYSTVRYRNGSEVAYSEVELYTPDTTGRTFTLTDIEAGSWDGLSVTIQYVYRPQL